MFQCDTLPGCNSFPAPDIVQKSQVSVQSQAQVKDTDFFARLVSFLGRDALRSDSWTVDDDTYDNHITKAKRFGSASQKISQAAFEIGGKSMCNDVGERRRGLVQSLAEPCKMTSVNCQVSPCTRTLFGPEPPAVAQTLFEVTCQTEMSHSSFNILSSNGSVKYMEIQHRNRNLLFCHISSTVNHTLICLRMRGCCHVSLPLAPCLTEGCRA